MRRLYCLAVFLAFIAPALAQNFKLDDARVPLAELKGDFRFHTGDDPQWSDPSFDDSAWPLLKSDRSWYWQGYKDLSGFAWYRFRVTFSPSSDEMSLLLPYVNNSYALYANGRLLGQVGNFPPHAKIVIATNNTFDIPRELVKPGQPVVFAVRVWRWPHLARYSGGGIGAAPFIGPRAAVVNFRDLRIHDTFWETEIDHVMVAANALSALVGLILFAARPREREYLWFGLAQTAWCVYSAGDLAFAFLRVPYVSVGIALGIASCFGSLLNLVFFHALLGLRRRQIFWIGATPLLLCIPLLIAAYAGLISFAQFDTVRTAFLLPYTLAVAILLLRASWLGNTEARLLVVPFTVSCATWLFDAAMGLLDVSRHPGVAAVEDKMQHLITWPFLVNWGNLIGLLCISSVCGVLLLRFARSRRDEERLAAELEAARVVQHVLIPNEVPAIPGFCIESVYRPAGQVGGDFFQIVPQQGGGALIAIGDVSGKGMPAAMTVSLLVGTFRTLAHFTDSPSQILTAMNQRMLGRSQGGFTTCLVMRLDGDGTLTMANAGHLAPYLDGSEVATENGLPLGLAADAEYPETTSELKSQGRLTLLTDGVVEARNAHGELLGFERTRELSMDRAEQVADAAQEFGQEDDITVLSLYPVVSAVPA